MDEIAEYIALDNSRAASRFVQKVFDRVELLEVHPKSGKRPPELPRTHYREVVVAPCRIFYRVEKDDVYILYLMRSERLLRPYLVTAHGATLVMRLKPHGMGRDKLPLVR